MALATPTAVVLELMTMVQQSAAHLEELHGTAPPQPPGQQHELAAEIVRCCDRVIASLSRPTAGEKRKAMEPCAATSSSPPMMMPLPPKRRARGAEALREIESSTTADGFIWRKYGQKHINGYKHPRLYYRCAFRDQGCGATRRVQKRQQEEPPAFVIAYYGEHTCGVGAVACHGGRAAMPPPAVVDFGSNAAAWGVVDADDRDRGSHVPLLLAAEQSFCGGDAPSETSQGWSTSTSSSSEVELKAREGGMAGAEEPCDFSPVLEFLDGCFDWESVVNSIDLGGLHQIDMFQ